MIKADSSNSISTSSLSTISTSSYDSIFNSGNDFGFNTISFNTTSAYHIPEIRYNCYDRSYVVKEDVLSEILPQSKLALNLLEFLDEETLNRFLSSIEKTCMNFSEVVTAIVENKICSEGFILNYQKYLSEKSILRQHRDLIFTGEYSTLSLFLKLR